MAGRLRIRIDIWNYIFIHNLTECEDSKRAEAKFGIAESNGEPKVK